MCRHLRTVGSVRLLSHSVEGLVQDAQTNTRSIVRHAKSIYLLLYNLLCVGIFQYMNLNTVNSMFLRLRSR